MNKILISAEVLQKLIFDRPEIEIELIGSAIAQISGRVADKIKEQLPNAQAQIDKAMREQLSSFTTNTRLHEPVKVLIREFLLVECAEFVKRGLSKAITDQALVRVDELVKARMLKVDQEVATMIANNEKRLQVTIVKMVGDETLKILRGVPALPDVA